MHLTVRDVARALQVPEKTVYRWIAQDGLPAHHIDDQYRFNTAELLEWASTRDVHLSPELLTGAENGEKALPRLRSALEAGGIHYAVGGGDKESALRAVVQLLPMPSDADRDAFLRVLLAREAAGSTAIGDGIAIPHVRNPIVLHVRQPAVTLCFLRKPIDFGALDGQPVGVLFTLVSPAVRQHLHLLSLLSFALRDADFKSAVLRQATAFGEGPVAPSDVERARSEVLAAAARAESRLAHPPLPPEEDE